MKTKYKICSVDEPDSGLESETCYGRSSDEDNKFDDRRNDFDDAMTIAGESHGAFFG